MKLNAITPTERTVTDARIVNWIHARRYSRSELARAF